MAVATVVFVLTAALARPAAGAEAAKPRPAQPSPGKLTGVVRDPAGAPAAGVRVQVQPAWRVAVSEAKAGGDGRYELDWHPRPFGGAYRPLCLVARDKGRNLAAVKEVDEDTHEADLRLEPCLVLTGRIQDGNGNPLAIGSVEVAFRIGHGQGTVTLDYGPARAEASGRFEVPALPRARGYVLRASALAYGSASRSLESDDTDMDRVELPPFLLKIADRPLSGVVVDTEGKPVAEAAIRLEAEGQPRASVVSDRHGRFKFPPVCEGPVNLSAGRLLRYGETTAAAGETNVVLVLNSNPGAGPEEPPRPSLAGKPLPDLAAVGLDAKAPVGKAILLCLFDLEQRPSRRALQLLGEQTGALGRQGLSVLGLQATPTTEAAWKDWLAARAAPFPVARLPEKTDKFKWAADVASLPWLILADKSHRVAAEGFAFEELEAKLKDLRE